MKIKIFDNSFSHSKTMGNCYPTEAKYFDWDRSEIVDNNNDIVFFTDNKLKMAENPKYRGKINVAMLLEPRVILPNIYGYIEKNYNWFDYVLTHHKYLLGLDKRFVWYAQGGCWIKPEDRKIHTKTKNISIIVSKKRNTKGQILRHDIIKLFGGKIDLVCGSGYMPIRNKIDALRDYRYSIIVENCKEETYFTEKLIDCWATGTIPIYYGCNINGVIPFNCIEDLELTIKMCNENFYKRNEFMINDNFNEAQKYVCIEDNIYENFLRNIINH